MSRHRVLLSWSSGKDSAWTLHVLRQQPEVELVGLLTTFNEAADRVAMHAVRRELALRQAKAAGLPLWDVPLPSPCSNEEYEARMRAVIAHGATDLVTPYFESQLILQQLPTFGDPDRLRLAVHPGGHMFYLRGDSRSAFRDDGERLVREVTGGPALR